MHINKKGNANKDSKNYYHIHKKACNFPENVVQ